MYTRLLVCLVPKDSFLSNLDPKGVTVWVWGEVRWCSLEARLLIGTLFFSSTQRDSSSRTFTWKTSHPYYLDCNNIVLVCNFLFYIFILVRCHKCRGFGPIRAQYPMRRGPVVPHHQQEKQPADQAKEAILNNYHFYVSLDNVSFL